MTNKRGPLSQVEIDCIKNNPNGLSVEELGKELNRSESQVQKFVDEADQESKERNEKPLEERKDEHITSTRKEGFVQQLMARKRRGVRNKPIATSMTPAASELGDELRKRVIPKKAQEGIHKIFDE